MLTLMSINIMMPYLTQEHGQAQLIMIVLSGLIEAVFHWLT